MNKKWDYKKIGEVMTVNRGGSPRPIKKYLTESSDGLNWIKIGDATASGKYIYETKQKITKDGLHKTRLVNEGDFLLSNSMSFGRPYIMGTKGCIHDGWLVLSEKKEWRLNKDFLYYLLGSPYIFSEFDRLAAGSTVRNLNIGLVSSVEIPIPPLTEQRQIVAILDKAFATIDQAKANIDKNIQNAQELFQSKLNEIFSQKSAGWEEKTLGEVCVVERGSSPRPIKKYLTDSEEGVNWIKIGDVPENDKYVKSTKQKITREGSKKSRFVDVGDFILSNSMSFGRPYIMAIQGYIHDGWFVLRLPDYLNPDYFWQLLASPYIKVQFNSLAAGAIVKNISGDLVKKALIPIPPIDDQEKIFHESEKLKNQTNLIINKYHLKAENLDELKKSTLQKAFAGELTDE